MIKIESVSIEEVRGVRTLSIAPGGSNFVIYGPNGAGKSGIVDAIEFGLTGSISRLSGKGTGKLSVKSHGPHVDCRAKPDLSRVRLTISLPGADTKVEIERSFASPKSPKLTPQDADVASVLDEFAKHWELALSRREIIKYVLTESSTRSKEVQALLRLDDVDQLRATLKTASNRAGDRLRESVLESADASQELKQHLQLKSLSKEGILNETNKRRRTVGLTEITELLPTTRLDEGVKTASGIAVPFGKKAAEQDVEALLTKLQPDSESNESKLPNDLLQSCLRLKSFSDFERTLRQNDLIELGLRLLDAQACPLCDTPWDLATLRQHLTDKGKTVSAVAEAEGRVRTLGLEFVAIVESFVQTVDQVRVVAAAMKEESTVSLLESWVETLRSSFGAFQSTDEVLSWESKLAKDWRQKPPKAQERVESLREAVGNLPDENGKNDALVFLVRAQERLLRYQKAKRQESRRRQTSDAVTATLKAYSDSVETVLANLYSSIESDLTEFYRFINQEDEAGFAAKLQHSAGKLDLNVDFYGRGFYPPAAYHSEGHQDGMGLCMFLALMNELSNGNFTLAILDDVVMSVDKEHRRAVCRLLLEKFPQTQFVITTHDEAWFRQMQGLGLVTRECTLNLHGWTVEGGPVAAQSMEVWSEIEAARKSNDVHGAAAKLRRHLEYVARELADNLGAKVVFRLDSNHDLGDLLPQVVGQWNSILKKAANSAQQWKNEAQQEVVVILKESFAAAVKGVKMEEWALNPTVHFNEWATFSAKEFRPVVESYRQLLSHWQCEQCESWVYLTPKKPTPEIARCKCGKKYTLNLRQK